MALPKETNTQEDLNVTKESKIEFVTPPIARTNITKPDVQTEESVSEPVTQSEEKPAVIVNPNYKNRMSVWMYIVPALVMVLVVIYILVF